MALLTFPSIIQYTSRTIGIQLVHALSIMTCDLQHNIPENPANLPFPLFIAIYLVAQIPISLNASHH